MDKLLLNFFNWDILAQAWPYLLKGLGMTVLLCLVVIPLGVCGGLAVALASRTRRRWMRWAVIFYVDLFRAFPPLVLIILFYFALPSLGVRMSGFVATWLALSLVLAAYAEEIFWAGIVAVPKGQWEAARSIGLDFVQCLRYVVLPQAVRITIPPLTNRTIAITKGTALGAVVAVGEILYQAQSAYSFSYNPSPLVLGAVAYLILFLPVVWFGRWVETRFAWKR